MNRRSFLRFLGLAPITAPLAIPTAMPSFANCPLNSRIREAGAAFTDEIQMADIVRQASDTAIRQAISIAESRSESRGLGRSAIAKAWVDPASRVFVAPSAGVHVTGIPAAAEHTIVLRTYSRRGTA